MDVWKLRRFTDLVSRALDHSIDFSYVYADAFEDLHGYVINIEERMVVPSLVIVDTLGKGERGN